MAGNILFRNLYGAFIMLAGLTCAADESKLTKLQVISPLPDELDECSGMATLDGNWLVGHNDSGDDALLYVFSLENPDKVRTVKVENADHRDWEELAEDDAYIYIGDFGNNSGKRKNLAIYIVEKSDVLDADEVDALRIDFQYPEQTKFKKSEDTNFDCEAMVCVGDSLYLFTKNHGNGKSDVYRLPKKPGEYDALWLGEFAAEGLVTGADYRIKQNRPELVLIGYTSRAFGHRPFILDFELKSKTGFVDATFNRILLEGHHQVETILFEKRKSLLISSEGKKKKDRNLYRVKR